MTGHGDWPLVVPPENPSEADELYQALSAPIEFGCCTCGDDAPRCVCGEDPDAFGDPCP